MLIFWEKHHKTIINFAFVIMVFFFMYFTFAYLIPFFAPFVVGLFIATINEPIIRFFEKTLKFNRKIASALSLLLSMTVICVILVFSSINIFKELINLKENLPEQFNISKQFEYLQNTLPNEMKYLQNFYEQLPDPIKKALVSYSNALQKEVEKIVTYLLEMLMSTIASIPRIAVFFIVALLSSFFISSDSKKIKSFIKLQIPSKYLPNFESLKRDTFNALFGYIKAVLILMALTFAEVGIGLTIIGVDYSILMASIIAIAEAIPILGTGVVMIPWIFFTFLIGNTTMAVGLIVIYVIGVILRQVFEPKIVGYQIGLHPLVTLLAMYIGLNVFGFLGVFIGPISVIVLKSLQKSGQIHLWKEQPSNQ